MNLAQIVIATVVFVLVVSFVVPLIESGAVDILSQLP